MVLFLYCHDKEIELKGKVNTYLVKKYQFKVRNKDSGITSMNNGHISYLGWVIGH